MTKSLRKTIILRSRLRNNFNKQSSDENWDKYKKQRTYFVKLLRQTKEKYFSDAKSISENQKFWKTIKPFFSNKDLNANKMILVEDNEIVREKEIMANIMNNYFINIATHLKVKLTKIDPKTDLESIIDNHESVQMIKLANFHSKFSLKFDSVANLTSRKKS